MATITCNHIAPLYGRLKMVSTLNNGKFKVQFISEDNIAKLKTPIKRWDNFQEINPLNLYYNDNT